jgi:hypothetical protein
VVVAWAVFYAAALTLWPVITVAAIAAVLVGGDLIDRLRKEKR